VAVFAQAVLAGLFLDGGDAWRGWHALNGMLVLPLLALIQVVLPCWCGGVAVDPDGWPLPAWGCWWPCWSRACSA
jgi:hypothetical protein